MDRNLILQIVLGSAAQRANTHFLILESFNVITDSRAFIAYNVSTGPAMMPPTQKVEFSLTYWTVSFYCIWNPIWCRFSTWLRHCKVVEILGSTLVRAVAESTKMTIIIKVITTWSLWICNWHSHHISLARQKVRLRFQLQHITIWSLFLLSCCPTPSSLLFIIAFFNQFGFQRLTTWLQCNSRLSTFNAIFII